MPILEIDPGLLGYLGALAPVACALAAVPTLEEARRGQLAWPRPVAIEPSELWREHRYLALTEASLREGRWWTLVSHMFLHQDEAHLTGNLATIATSGRLVYGSVGPFGLYAVFLLAGAAAGANRGGRLQQLEAQIGGAAPSLPESVSRWVPAQVRDLVGAGIAKVAQKGAPLVGELTVDLGASGGACGLMGFGFGVTLERLAGARLFGAGDGGSGAQGAYGAGVGWLYAALMALDCAGYLAREWQRFCGCDGFTGVDHIGHLTGFAAGLGLFVALRVAESAGDPPGELPLRPPGDRRSLHRGTQEDGWLRVGAGARGAGRRYVDAEGCLH